ncbi:flagellar protein FliT [Propionivibrio sp.]|uniref:flagellar protein FliT n=1 Tax=Propionivibrio sp. TaxID=2212460 RepID=UPI00272DECE7|nr:flagellar protein FliT [Propionivibrio sp.]
MSSGQLAKIEEITLEMQEAAREENWAVLASLESRRIALVETVDWTGLRTPENRALLARIIEINASLVQRLQNRKTDINLLLNGLSGHSEQDS